MCASTTLLSAITISPGDALRLRYALYVHAGSPPTEQTQAQWSAFAQQPFREFVRKK